MNGGVMYDGEGGVSGQYGSDCGYNEVKELGEMYGKMIVMKDSGCCGKERMLWDWLCCEVKED